MAERRRLDVILSAIGVRAFRRDFGGASQAMKGLETRTERLGRSLRTAASRVSGISIAFAGVGAAATAGVRSFLNFADDIDKASQRAGLARSTLQELRFAADLSGVSSEQLGSSMEALRKRLGEARSGTGALVTLLKKTSPELLHVLQSAGSTEEGFNILVEAISQLGNETDKAALIAAAFSRQGLALAPLLQAGTDAISDMREEARDLNIVLGDEAIDAGRDTKDNFTRLGAALSGVGRAIGGDLAPQLEQMSQFLVDLIPSVREFITSIGGGRTVLIGVAAILAGGLVAGIVAIGLAIGGIPLLIGGAIAGLVLLVTHFEKIRDAGVKFFGELRDEIASLLPESVLSFLSTVAGGVANKASTVASVLGSASALAQPAAAAVTANPDAAFAREFASRRAEVSGKVGVDVRVSDDRVRATVVEGEATGGIEIDAAAGPALAAAS